MLAAKMGKELTGGDQYFPKSQGLRSAPQPLQRWESQAAAPQTEEPLEFVDAQVPLMSFVLQHTKSGETAGHMMPLRPLRTRLTAGQPELILTDPNDFFDLGAECIQATYLRGCKRQAIGGVVLGAVSDDQDFQASGQPAAFDPIGVAPIRPESLPVEATILLEAAHTIPPRVPNPLQQTSGGVPGVEEHRLGATA
jgi:hypothetical protein